MALATGSSTGDDRAGETDQCPQPHEHVGEIRGVPRPRPCAGLLLKRPSEGLSLFPSTVKVRHLTTTMARRVHVEPLRWEVTDEHQSAQSVMGVRVSLDQGESPLSHTRSLSPASHSGDTCESSPTPCR